MLLIQLSMPQSTISLVIFNVHVHVHLYIHAYLHMYINRRGLLYWKNWLYEHKTNRWFKDRTSTMAQRIAICNVCVANVSARGVGYLQCIASGTGHCTLQHVPTAISARRSLWITYIVKCIPLQESSIKFLAIYSRMSLFINTISMPQRKTAAYTHYYVTSDIPRFII